MSNRLAALVLLAAGAAAAAAAPDVDALLRTADASRLALEEGVLHVRVTVTEEGRPADVSVLDVYVRGADHVLCVFREGLQQGRRILVVGDRTWLLLPDVAKPIPINAGQRLLGGASVADLARLQFADFDAEVGGTEVVDGTSCLVLDLVARVPRAAYASGRLWVGEQDHLPRRARLALRSGREAKDLHFVAYDREDGRAVLRRMEIEHLLFKERRMRTVLEFLDYEARSLDAALFEPAGARELR